MTGARNRHTTKTPDTSLRKNTSIIVVALPRASESWLQHQRPLVARSSQQVHKAKLRTAKLVGIVVRRWPFESFWAAIVISETYFGFCTRRKRDAKTSFQPPLSGVMKLLCQPPSKRKRKRESWRKILRSSTACCSQGFCVAIYMWGGGSPRVLPLGTMSSIVHPFSGWAAPPHDRYGVIRFGVRKWSAFFGGGQGMASWLDGGLRRHEFPCGRASPTLLLLWSSYMAGQGLWGLSGSSFFSSFWRACCICCL
jgi:hypothetical protein